MAKHTKKSSKKKRRRLLVIEIACVIIAIVCAGLIVMQMSHYWTDDNEFQELTQDSGRDIERLETDNPNCVGWIRIDGTRVDYPVMYTPDDPEYYLHRNFEGEESFAGTPFLGKGSNPDGNSLIIYGHNMKDGSMFASLLDYADPDFGMSHPIEYKTIDGVGTYLPISCFYCDLTSPNPYRYWDQVGTLDKQRFNDYVAAVKGMSLYSTGVGAAYGDELITLSTCSYGTDDQRFVVVAVKQ